MKKILKSLLMSLVLFAGFQLNAQNKPDASSTRPTASNALPAISHNGTDKINYVRTFDLLKSFTTFPENVPGGTQHLTNAINNGDIIQATQYIDGLGRPVQTVVRQGSGNAKDLISYMLYDHFGRQVYQPMSYEQTSADGGAIVENPSTNQNTFLNNHYAGEDIFYGKIELESSPLNRVIKQLAPGNSWAGNNKGVSQEYATNIAADGVRIWNPVPYPVSSGTYAAGELSVMITTDENDNQVKEYTNQKGQVILKKVQKEATLGNGHTDWLNTYYLYDDYGNLRYVLPPRAVELLEANSWNWVAASVDELVFIYVYDHRNRITSKKVPGAHSIFMVYDQLDRLVLTQDGNQRDIPGLSDQWTFTKYDELNRPVLTGFITSTNTHAQMQTAMDDFQGSLYVEREELTGAGVLEGATITVSNRDTNINTYRSKTEGFIDFLPGFESATNDDFETERNASLTYEYTNFQGYYDATFPRLVDYPGYEFNTVNYYDDYDFTPKEWDDGFVGKGFYASGTENAVTPVEYTNVRGMATGSKVRILGTDDWLTTVMFYDDRGRVVQTQGDNHLGGTDVTTTQYDFAGRVLHTYTVHHNPQATINATTRILKEFGYDHAGRLLTVKEKLGDTGSLKLLVTNSYNALGELETKTLGSNLESLDYVYNVRGWLKSINGDELEDTDQGTAMTNHYFAMDLSYDYGFETNQLNGNIAGVKWKSKGSDQHRAYGFTYDKVNRLTKADYTQGSSWNNTVNDFTTGYDYDANGNILKLFREGVVAGTITTLDSLSYGYGSGHTKASNANQLLKVKDKYGDLGQGDFKDGTNTNDDYVYDLNGNMTKDRNKGITDITYNHLNLPVVVSFGSSKSITYTYDAAGIKLSKVVNDNGSLTTTDYAGGFIYENNALQHFAHEEGRVRKANNGDLVYDYFIKDHLGNTRMTLTETIENTIYEATMETDLASFEEQVFLNIPATRSTEEAFQGSASAKLGPESIGPAKMLVVSPGDKVDLSVYVKYPNAFVSTNSGDEITIGDALASLFGVNGGAATVYEQGVYDNLNNNAGTFLASVNDPGSSTVPKAYLNYLFFDQDFNFVAAKSDYVPADAGAKGVFDLLEANNITIEQAGYLYVYVSNEGRTTDGGNVYFDALRIDHTKGHILQEDHYYPFGLSIKALSSSAPLSTPNKFKYNGKEIDNDFDLDWYHYEARIYDPQIGRFPSIDPISSYLPHVSPYNYAENEPAGSIDFWGLQRMETTQYDINRQIIAAPTKEKKEQVKQQYLRDIKAQQPIGEFVAGFTPIGLLWDAVNFATAAGSGDGSSMLMAGIGFLPFGDFAKIGKLGDSFRGLKVAGKVDELTGFEKVAADAISAKGDQIIGMGDEAVRKSLGLGKGEGNIADFLSVTGSGRFNIAEVKGSFGKSGADVSHALKQIDSTVSMLKNKVNGAKIGTLEIVLPRGANLSGNFAVSGNRLVRTTENGMEAVKVQGRAVNVRFLDN